MKTIKKLASVLLAMVMALALAIPAFAATNDASITIKPAEGSNTEGNTTTYTYYQLLHATINGEAVSYYLTNGTDDTLRNLLDAVTVKGSDLFTFTQTADGSRWIMSINNKADGSAYTDSDGADIAEALNTDAIKAAALSSNTFTAGTGGVAKAENLEKGYYLITSTLGTELVLDTLGNEEITTKNDYITNTKTVSKVNLNVGDIVTYTITVHIPATAVVGDTVTVHDTLDEHLKIDMDSIKAKYVEDGADVGVDLSDGTKKANTETFAKSFTITDAMLGKDVILTYNAELLSTAVDDTGYVNDAYTNVPGYDTEHTTVDVWTFDFDLDKNFAGAEGDATKIAKFELTDSEGHKIEFIKDTTGYVKADSDDTDKTTTLEVNGAETINIRGLAAGTYTLTEIETADGYNLLKESVTVTITDTTDTTAATVTPSHTVSYKVDNDDLKENVENVEILNNAGSELPSTGGIGTTIFYIVGGLLVVGAVVVLITKRRASAGEE